MDKIDFSKFFKERPRVGPETYFDDLDPQQTLHSGSRIDAETMSRWFKEKNERAAFDKALKKHLEKCLDIAVSKELLSAGIDLPDLCERYVALVWAETLHYITTFKLELCIKNAWENWKSPYYKAFYLTYTDPGYICEWGKNENP
jgi:hypothetical protein